MHRPIVILFVLQDRLHLISDEDEEPVRYESVEEAKDALLGHRALNAAESVIPINLETQQTEIW
jgi:hypothetical protein